MLLLLSLLGTTPARAQSEFERVAFETAIGIDLFRGENAADRPQVIIDLIGTVRVTDRWQLYVRPWFRQPRTSEWDEQIYQAAIRYERPGRVATRVDAGYIASPVGLGLLDASPRTNPTIGPHLDYFLSMLPFDTEGPRVSAIASTYPLGAVIALSTDRWDARAALVNSAPTRIFVLGGSSNPRATPVFEAGAGLTPKVGFRIGASFARGAYLTHDELPEEPYESVIGSSITALGALVSLESDEARNLTLVAVEGEFAAGHTRVSGELVHDQFTVPGGSVVAYTGFIQGVQTLTPRWFVAGRFLATSAPVTGAGSVFGSQPDLNTGELTAGYRVTREVTVRGSYYSRKRYGQLQWDNQAGASVVWARRWW
jgi:hypothetical protein